MVAPLGSASSGSSDIVIGGNRSSLRPSYVHNTEVYDVSGAPSVFWGRGAWERWYLGHPLRPTLINPGRPGNEARGPS